MFFFSLLHFIQKYKTGLARTVIIAAALFFLFVGEGASLHQIPEDKIVGMVCSTIAAAITFFFLFHWPKTSFKAPDISKHRNILALGIAFAGVLFVATGATIIGFWNISYLITLKIMFSVFSIVAAWSIWKDKPWASPAIKVIAFLYVLAGGAWSVFGVYAWWVLSPPKESALKKYQVKTLANVQGLDEKLSKPEGSFYTRHKEGVQISIFLCFFMVFLTLYNIGNKDFLFLSNIGGIVFGSVMLLSGASAFVWCKFYDGCSFFVSALIGLLATLLSGFCFMVFLTIMNGFIVLMTGNPY